MLRSQLLFLILGLGILAPSFANSEFDRITAQIKDSALAECVRASATDNGWKTPGQVTKIKCHSKGIKSLQGIEAFSNLQLLSLNNNKLKSLDISLKGFQQLQMLNLARNNIKQLSVSNLPKLKKLYAFGNEMTVFLVKDLPELVLVKVHNNQLEQFEYSGVNKLQKIYVFNNELETIDIYSAPKLTYMDCRQNPMPDELYDEMDEIETAAFLHDGNADDWQ